MTSDRLNEALAEAGVGTWQSALGGIALAIVKAVAPQLLELLERLAVSGSLALLKRLQDAMVPEPAADVALDIVRGLERDHPDWPGTQLADYGRAAIEVWMKASGGKPDAALVNQVLEEAVGRLRIEQAKINQQLATQGQQKE